MSERLKSTADNPAGLVPSRILVLDNNDTSSLKVARALKRLQSQNMMQGTTSLVWRKSLAEGLFELGEGAFDTIIVDGGLLPDDKIHGLDTMLGKNHATAIIVLVETDNSEVSRELFAQGVQDVVIKDRFLGRALLRAIRFAMQRQSFLQKVYEAQVTAQAAVKAKDSFISNITHELRTPLTSVIGYTEELISSSENWNRQEADDALQTILQSSQHLLELINDILDFAKLSSDGVKFEVIDFSPLDVIETVTRLVTPLVQRKQIGFELDYLSEIPRTANSDPTRLKQVLINLIGNAVKFTNQGKVRLEVSFDPNAGEFRFTVDDTGIGIPEDRLDKLFEPFSQGDPSVSRIYGGTGLGLTICQQLVQRAGGQIGFETEVGAGSTFYFHWPVTEVSPETVLPQDENRARQQETAELTSMPEQLSGKVLLVEDGPENQKFIRYLLGKFGVDVTLAENGEQALVLQEKERYQLILLDLNLPGISGCDVARALREKGVQTPIVALTADAEQTAVDRAMEAGCSDYLSKPIDRQRFYSVLRDNLSPATTHEEGAERSSMCEEEPDFIPLLLHFLDQLPIRIGQLREAFERSDLETLTSIAHQLNGSAHSYGYPKLGELAVQLEKIGKSRKVEDLLTAVERIESAVRGILSRREEIKELESGSDLRIAIAVDTPCK